MKQTKKYLALIFAAMSAASCAGEAANNQTATPGENSSATANANPVRAAETPQTPLESELSRLQRANFRQIVAFSRKDAGKLTREDVDYFRQYAPTEQINQRLKTDDEKYIVAGTNFVFTPEQMEALKKRFAVEDFTEKYGRKPEAPPKQQ